MKNFKTSKKVLALLLSLSLIFTMMPATAWNAFAAEQDDALTAALDEAKAYTDGITINNSSNDPATVVKTFKTHFTWDNEKRENGKDYLFDWSYYNGVVFEGMEYLYEITGEKEYKDYVIEYMSSLIAENGTWAKCTNNSSKECAGYNSTHGADCYKTASLLLDTYEMTEDSRYLTMAETLYADLDAAASKYSLPNAGSNYRHTWASDPSPDLWLDGLYMILPFRAEYAKHIGDTEELDLIVDRMQWVSDNMYNSSKGLFYHAADSASSNSGTYWLRSIGWYAAAIVDIMDSMEGENLEAMKKQLVKLVDGMKACQNSSNGMWLNNMNASQSSTNPYETSGTALTCYAVMKAVNNGWLDESYADMAILAFEGICKEKLSGETLTDICFKGAPGSSNSTFYDNEGKGVGPFIMFYAEVLEYVNKQQEEETPVEPEVPETPVEPFDKTVVLQDGTEIKVTNVICDVQVAEVTADDETLINAKNYDKYIAYDITTCLSENETSTISIPVPAEWNATEEELVGISVEDGVLKQIKGTFENGIYSFDVNHFSAKGVAYNAKAAEETPGTATGNLKGTTTTTYTLTNELEDGKEYLIVSRNNAGNGTALGSGASGVSVTVGTGGVISDPGNAIVWTANGSGSTWSFSNGSGYLGYTRSGSWTYTYSLNSNSEDPVNWTAEGNTVKIELSSGRFGSNDDYYIVPNSPWSMSTSSSSVYFYEKTETTSTGAEVTFNLDPTTVALKVNGTTDLEATVKVGGISATSTYITWASSDSKVATVDENGKVTAVGAGEATITATLTKANGTELVSPLVLRIPVTVEAKQISSAKLTGNDAVITRQNVEPDFSNIKLKVTYDDGSNGEITTANGLQITGYNVTEIGSSYATISYNGVEYGTVRVTVEGNPYEGLEEATVYPEYPENGAVRVDKTATEIDFENTGVVKVELDVAGVSVKPAVDVILVTDLSNSMAWKAGSRTDATSHEATKVYNLQQSVASFADIFLAADDDGNATKNTMSLVTFGGYDADHTNKVYTDYADPTQTLLLGSSDADAVKSTINNIRVLADDALNVGTSTTGYYLSFDGGETYGENYGNTNYDHAFMQTAEAIENLKAAYKDENDTEYDASGRQIYVLFMTDGAPSNYNGVYYNYKTGDRADVNCTWVNEEGEEDTYTMGNNRAQYQAGPWFEYIAGGAYDAEKGTVPGNPLYWADQVYNTESVADVYNVGFDLDNGGFSSMTFTEADERPLAKVLEKMVTGKTLEVFSADNEDGLAAIYANLATKIRFAGTEANVTDVIDSDFTLQLTQATGSTNATFNGDLGFKPTIDIKTYELWTKAETDDLSKIGTRKTNEEGSYVSSVIESVTFNEAGTEAYSTLVENGTKNIMKTDDGTVTIVAHYFTYEKTPEGVETFKWNLGDITDKEIALSFYAYLEGSLEGDRPNGLYYTNEEASVEYIDINGKHATQEFPVPAVAWGGASTSYEFYLVNDDGEPCDREGKVIPFANRIIITGPYYEELYLNQEDEEKATEIIAAYVLPAGYVLYDDTAKYTVVTASGTREGSLNISDPAPGKVQTTVVVSATEPTYVQSRVAFGVNYLAIPEKAEFELTPSEIVVDYGKDILANTSADETLDSDLTFELVGFSRYYDKTDLKQQFANTSAIDGYAGTYGIFSIEDANNRIVRYTQTKFMSGVEKVFCVVKVYNKTTHDSYYMVDPLIVIPATTMYYETDFAGNVFTTSGAWKLDAKVENDIPADGPQDAGTIGVDQTYGYDSTYENDSKLSDGSSLFVEGEGVKTTTSKFSFTGTGFELISRTGAAQGAIRVDIYTDQNRTKRAKSITVLNKSESELELYQIPVVSVNDLAYNTYYVTVGVNAAYDDPNFDALDRGGEFYFDAIRIFDPAKGNADAEDAYMEDNEYNMSLIEVRSQLIADGYGEFNEVEVKGVTFVDNINSGKVEEGEDGTTKPVTGETGSVEVGKYSSIGPNNEVYLEKGQGIVFAIDWKNKAPRSIDIGAKTITGEKDAQIKAYISENATKPATAIVDGVVVKSSTAQFYNLVNRSNATTFSGDNKSAYVFVMNTGEGVLSITDIKVAYGYTAQAVEEISFLSNARTLAFARACVAPQEIPDNPVVPEGPETPDTPAVPDTPVVPEEPETPDTPVVPDTPVTPEEPETPPVVDEPEEPVVTPAKIISVKTDKKTYVQGDKIKVTVTTNSATTKVKVGTKTLKTFKAVKGNRTWTTTVNAAKIGKLSINAVAYNNKGTATKKVTKTVTVKKFAPKIFKVNLNKTKVKVGAKYTVTVKAGSTVKHIRVNGKKITKFTTKNGVKTFKVTLKATKVGKQKVKVVAYNKALYPTNPKFKTVTVKRK